MKETIKEKLSELEDWFYMHAGVVLLTVCSIAAVIMVTIFVRQQIDIRNYEKEQAASQAAMAASNAELQETYRKQDVIAEYNAEQAAASSSQAEALEQAIQEADEKREQELDIVVDTEDELAMKKAKRWADLADIDPRHVPTTEEGIELWMSMSDEEFESVIQEFKQYEAEQAERDARNPVLNVKPVSEYLEEARILDPEVQKAQEKVAEMHRRHNEKAQALGYESYQDMVNKFDEDGDGGLSVPEAYKAGWQTKEEYDAWLKEHEFAQSVVWGEVGEGTKAAAKSDYQ